MGLLDRRALCYHPALMSETTTTDLKQRIKILLVERLRLEIEADSISDSEPLFGEGLGLDSIDALELVLGIEQEFGVKIEDEEVGAQVLASIDSLADFVRTKTA
jgi:acyl carrier protein